MKKQGSLLASLLMFSVASVASNNETSSVTNQDWSTAAHWSYAIQMDLIKHDKRVRDRICQRKRRPRPNLDYDPDFSTSLPYGLNVAEQFNRVAEAEVCIQKVADQAQVHRLVAKNRFKRSVAFTHTEQDGPFDVDEQFDAALQYSELTTPVIDAFLNAQPDVLPD